MPKADTKCWSCGQDTMISFKKLGHGWLKCSNCGATDMPNPTKPGHPAFVLKPDRATGGESWSPWGAGT